MKTTIFTLFASIFTLAVLVWLAVTSNFKMSKWHGYVMLATYAIIVIVILF